MKRITTLLMGAGALALAACSGGGESGNNPAANAAGDSAGEANATATDPNDPFAAIDMQMHERMIAATGANASETWVRKMIEHHRGAVAMSQVLIDRGGDAGYVQMARSAAEKQQREIGELERLLAGGVPGGSGEANPYGPAEQAMHRQMTAATGANLSETWARKMIAHHQGAVAMSEVLIRQGGDPQVVALARRVAEEQGREIAHLEAMLRGEAMPAAGAPAAAAASPAKQAPRDGASPAPPRPNAPPKAAPAQQPKQSAPPPTPRPEPATPPKAECAPEHRALGHC